MIGMYIFYNFEKMNYFTVNYSVVKNISYNIPMQESDFSHFAMGIMSGQLDVH